MNTNKYIASCGQEVKIHEWPSAKVLYSVSPAGDANSVFRSVSWSISGKQLLVISPSSKPMLIKRGSEQKDSQFTMDVLENVQLVDVGIFSKNSEELVAFGTVNGEVYVMDISTNTVSKSYPSLPSPVTFLDYTPKDTFLAAGCKSGQIFLYNTCGDVCASFFVPWSHSLSCMIFHPTRESYLIAASKEGVVAIWDVRSNTAKFTARNHTKTITDMAVSATEELLATVGLDRNVYIYDLRNKEIVFRKVFSAELSAVTCSLAGEEFAVGTTRGRIFFVDRKLPDYTKGSISAQKDMIKCIRYCNSLPEEKNSKLKQILSEPILVDEESTAVPLSNMESDLKTQASGDFTLPDDKSEISRIPGGMDDGLENNTEKWIEQLHDNPGDKQVPFLQVIEESSLHSMKNDIMKTSKDIVQKFMEEINTQFLKIRMGVSREFCRIEQNNNKRWQDFNATLLKLAGCEEVRRDSEHVLSTITNESQNTLPSKQESMYSPAKTKITTYTTPNDNKS